MNDLEKFRSDTVNKLNLVIGSHAMKTTLEHEDHSTTTVAARIISDLAFYCIKSETAHKGYGTLTNVAKAALHLNLLLQVRMRDKIYAIYLYHIILGRPHLLRRHIGLPWGFH